MPGMTVLIEEKTADGGELDMLFTNPRRHVPGKVLQTVLPGLVSQALTETAGRQISLADEGLTIGIQHGHDVPDGDAQIGFILEANAKECDQLRITDEAQLTLTLAGLLTDWLHQHRAVSEMGLTVMLVRVLLADAFSLIVDLERRVITHSKDQLLDGQAVGRNGPTPT
ncbi:hypothetical protein JNJ66_01895 [Candidatus Saccharibacteria bacterium]|nr:hypothetical protein [Candidatus Saccharibacteria bacterium]